MESEPSAARSDEDSPDLTGWEALLEFFGLRQPKHSEPSESVDEQLIRECRDMLSYALASGEQVPKDLVQRLGNAGCGLSVRPEERGSLAGPCRPAELTECHNELAAIVGPATPRGIAMLGPCPAHSQGRPAIVTKTCLKGRLRLAATLLVLTLGSAMLADLWGGWDGVVFSILSGRDSVEKYLWLPWVFPFYLWLIAISAWLGSLLRELSFALGFIDRTQYDRQYEASSTVRMVVGVATGVVLAIFLGEVTAKSTIQLPPMTWALLGGYSSDAVLRMIASVVDALKGLMSKGQAAEEADRNAAAAKRAVQPRTAGAAAPGPAETAAAEAATGRAETATAEAATAVGEQLRPGGEWVPLTGE